MASRDDLLLGEVVALRLMMQRLLFQVAKMHAENPSEILRYELDAASRDLERLRFPDMAPEREEQVRNTAQRALDEMHTSMRPPKPQE